VKWVRDAKSLPLIQRTGDTFKSILQQYTPEASRRGEPQQGSLHSPKGQDFALLASRDLVTVAHGPAESGQARGRT
jgi:hypothetical protein